MLGRLQHLGAIAPESYGQISRRWKEQDAASRPSRPPGGGLKAPKRCLLERGEPFVSLIVRAVERELITPKEANTYLGVKLKDFRQLARGA